MAETNRKRLVRQFRLNTVSTINNHSTAPIYSVQIAPSSIYPVASITLSITHMARDDNVCSDNKNKIKKKRQDVKKGQAKQSRAMQGRVRHDIAKHALRARQARAITPSPPPPLFKNSRSTTRKTLSFFQIGTDQDGRMLQGPKNNA